MTGCHRCRQPLGLISYTVGVWAGDELLAEAELCSTCGGPLGDPQFMRTTGQGELPPG